MQELELDDRAYCDRRRRIAAVRPRIYEDGDSVTLQFQIGEIQSQMLVSDPYYLVLSYTRAMMAFLLFNREPKHIAVIGLGGGSIPKWCYRHLADTDITVVEINPNVIALREQFHIPTDDYRFRVICGDGADYVAATSDSPEALLVDGFDVLGQPPQLCSQQFYDDCYRALAPNGVLVVNLCGLMDQQSIDRIRKSFDGRVRVIIPEDGENRIVFAIKGESLWRRYELTVGFAQRLRAGLLPGPFLEADHFFSASREINRRG